MAEGGKEEKKKRKQGGLRTMPFILGRFWTITVGSISFLFGMIGLTIAAVLPGLRPPPCSPPYKPTCKQASPQQLLVLYMSLLFTSIGSGGIRPCVMAFGADQFDLHRPRHAAGRKWNFFNLYFFSMALALLLALTVVVYVQENVGWGWGFGIPAIAMFFSVVAFVIGYPLYIRLKPGGSPLIRLTQVLVAAFRKRKVVKPGDPSLLYENNELDAGISTTGRLLHTNQLVFFDRAAIMMEGDMLISSGQPRLWRVSTVHRVEELKSIIRMIPIWAVGILLVAANSHNHTFAIQQARSMDRHLTARFQIPPASMNVFSALSMLLGLAFYDRVFVPVARRVTKRPSGITYLQRMGIGLAIAIFATVAAALVEIKRKAVASDHGLLDKQKVTVPISVFWLMPQFAIHGLAEAFMSVGHMEFLYDQAPESMRSTAAALYWLAVSIGNYMGTLLVTLVHNFTEKKGDWLQNNINRGKLNDYYWLMSGLQVLNLIYYIVCAKFYTFKPLEAAKAENPSKVVVEEVSVRETEFATVVTRDAKDAGN
ncbi:protein NRT1/ PTR FAMILY 3.1-like isoform X2 [Phoenix dactylifera]|uniref:Protein NRT1/ PTR FAMILY 3.1-like isoform X2 n=1 Tax=Phoenix dactylifera TaxID=42345 RepID=A0A8B8JBT4_PHODC|nr:protein NRT1/ PTR FAMILY 3.1-like isoform X2 [Phoenix dactylifera]